MQDWVEERPQLIPWGAQDLGWPFRDVSHLSGGWASVLLLEDFGHFLPVP